MEKKLLCFRIVENSASLSGMAREYVLGKMVLDTRVRGSKARYQEKEK